MLKAKVVMPDGVVVATDEGTPQGGPLSPLLSNVVLDELDRELEERGHRFVRYADDCNIYVRSERAGLRVMASVTRFLESRMRLTVNRDKSAVARGGRHFLGFGLRVNSQSRDAEVFLSKRSRDRIDAKSRQLVPRSWGQSVDDCIQRLNRYLNGWIAFFQVCTSGATFETLDGHIRRRLRALLLKQWKRKGTIAKRLMQLGAAPNDAWICVRQGNRSWWALSHTPAVDNTLDRRYFRKRGLVSLQQRWTEPRKKARAAGSRPSRARASASAS